LSATDAKLAGDRAFGSPLITNIHRGIVVEAIVSTALSDWTWCSEDYYRFDFRHRSGVGLEVKQSAACQSWESKVPSSASWDISARKSVYEGDRYGARLGRHADIYVLAWHPIVDRAVADHRDPARWQFFVVAAADLPLGMKRIGMKRAKTQASSVGITGLASEVTKVRGGTRDTVSERRSFSGK
jgi:hypothetical protein